MASETVAFGHLDDRAQIDLLHSLVALPSLSFEEADAVRFLVDWMAANGFQAHIDEIGNAIGTVGQGERHIVLLGHIDTVQPRRGRHRRAEAERAGDRRRRGW
jgi:LysW-gamma-L-lysine carboxypeptidase